jgi:hypothetical protein
VVEQPIRNRKKASRKWGFLLFSTTSLPVLTSTYHHFPTVGYKFNASRSYRFVKSITISLLYGSVPTIGNGIDRSKVDHPVEGSERLHEFGSLSYVKK